MLVECSRLNFRAIAKRALFYQDELVGPNELLLGTGCQAIRVRPDELDFDYLVSLCGIVAQVREMIGYPVPSIKPLEVVALYFFLLYLLLVLLVGTID